MKMKIVKWIMCGIMLMSYLVPKAQTSAATKLNSTITPLWLAIGTDKTTNLIFPYSIISVDKGSKDVLVQKAKGVENILQVKAGSETMKETNLTIVTADGTLFSFLLQYAAQPSLLNFNVGITNGAGVPVGILDAGADNEARLQKAANVIAGKQPYLKVRAKDGAIDVHLKGIYIREGNLFFQLTIKNSSNIRYDIEQLRFFIKDQKQSKRTASQELEQTPVHVQGNLSHIATRSESTIVFVLPKFTIPDQKMLLMQLMERNGGRHLQMKIKNKMLTSAKEMPVN